MKALKNSQQLTLNLEIPCTIIEKNLSTTKKAIENEQFPFEILSIIAELESWRKEVYRPIYYIHKWWARRLGSVFRAILIGAFAPQGTDVLDWFYKPVNFKGVTVFDPFMGSGTTIGEAIKLGATAIGRDINPVAYFLVKNALIFKDREGILDTFNLLQEKVSEQLKSFYTTILDDGKKAEVLYYFWVQVVPCPKCGHNVDLFSSYIFSKHAYPQKVPEAQSVCPSCDSINTIKYNAQTVNCNHCHTLFNPQIASVKGKKASCLSCHHTFVISDVVKEKGKPPDQRMYAKLVLLKDGTKRYLSINEYDKNLYQKAQDLLKQKQNAYPVVTIQPGYNTNQVLNYCYHYWHQMFNERQLLCLSVLAEEIRKITHSDIRDIFKCLFSGILEFNNMFASFKGEGTGAVRPIFFHHFLKPERTPIEANIWGTYKSSGSFLTLFESRIMRAINYCQEPFEIKPIKTKGKLKAEKIYRLSPAIDGKIVNSFSELSNEGSVYLSCGDSAKTDLPTKSIDMVITDPPFFDNVHYSQIADFFYVWQRYVDDLQVVCNDTTRQPEEVQASDPDIFSQRLQKVFIECDRVLKPQGLMIFCYHHSKPEGWRSVLIALVQAGFAIVATHPIKSEMSVATPKSQTKEPIDLDIIIVCKKRNQVNLSYTLTQILEEAIKSTTRQVKRFNGVGRRLSRNDTLVVFMAQLLKYLSLNSDLATALSWLNEQSELIQKNIENIYIIQK